MHRVLISVNLSRPKVQKLPVSQNGNGQKPTPHEETLTGGTSPGKLRQKARFVNLRAMDSKLMAELGKEKVGTLKMETQAIQL